MKRVKPIHKFKDFQFFNKDGYVFFIRKERFIEYEQKDLEWLEYFNQVKKIKFENLYVEIK